MALTSCRQRQASFTVRHSLDRTPCAATLNTLCFPSTCLFSSSPTIIHRPLSDPTLLSNKLHNPISNFFFTYHLSKWPVPLILPSKLTTTSHTLSSKPHHTDMVPLSRDSVNYVSDKAQELVSGTSKEANKRTALSLIYVTPIIS